MSQIARRQIGVVLILIELFAPSVDVAMILMTWIVKVSIQNLKTTLGDLLLQQRPTLLDVGVQTVGQITCSEVYL